MLFDKYGEYHKEQKKEWQIDKGIKKGAVSSVSTVLFFPWQWQHL